MVPFQEAIRAAYPVLSGEYANGVVMGTERLVAEKELVAWRFEDINGTWRVSLAKDFVALETSEYTSRGDFLDRLRALLTQVSQHFEPALAQRVGFRFIDRVTGDQLDNIDHLIRPEMLGIVSSPMFEHVQHALSDVLVTVPGASAQLRARWGYLPEGVAADAGTLEPVPERSWILDIDMYSLERGEFDVDALIDGLRGFAERLYTVFRWTVTDEFLRQYGGDL